MGGSTYTVEQLQRLRESPLVHKPEGLPAIEQWMDLPADQAGNNNNNNNRGGRPRNQGDTVPGEGRQERPALVNTGSMGHFGRRASMQPEDTVLGPPKLSFTSASRKGAESSEKRGITSIDGDHLGDRFPSRQQRGERWTRDREGDPGRDKTSYTNGRRGAAREEGEEWTNVKGRKSLGQEDFDRGFGRNGDRTRDRNSKEVDPDAGDAPTRRTGAGRDKFERWGRRDDTVAKESEGGTARGGWRDRERDRERDRDRDWTRGGNKAEEDPEWMDTVSGKEKKQAHTQEEFQRWKEQMKAKDTPAVEKEERKVETPATTETSVPNMFSPPSAKAVNTPSGLENPGIFFGNWGKEKGADLATGGTDTITAKPKQDKKSRFMTMFAKPEEQTAPAQPYAPTPASPGLPPPDANGNNEEDKVGFQRILQMLDKTNLGAAAQAGAPGSGNVPKSGGIFLRMQPQPPPEERPDSHSSRPQVPRTLEQQAMLENILAPKPSAPEKHSPARFNAMSPENQLYEQLVSRPESNRPIEEHLMPQPPSRNSSAQDANLHALLNSRTREEANRDPTTKQRERDFLLTLMQQPSRATPPQTTHLGRMPPENPNMPFYDQGPQRQQPQPKNRAVPPGFMEDPRFIAENEMMRQQQMREQQLHLQQQQQEAMRAKNARMPTGFNPGLDHPMLERRNTAGEIPRDIPRQMTNMGIPSQPVPDMQMFGGRNQGMPPTPQERPNIAPPPGFGGPAGMRQPPGLGPNGPPQMQSFSSNNTPLGHPPGFPPQGLRGMYPGGQGPNQMPPQGPPQGYFPPPPNYGPPPGFRGAEDPRMMMGRPDMNQEQYGPGPRGGGRPPNMPW